MLFNEISENCSINEYGEEDNTLGTSEEVYVSKIDWREKLFSVETVNSDSEDEDEDESQESSSSSIITPKEEFHFLIKCICLSLIMNH